MTNPNVILSATVSAVLVPLLLVLFVISPHPWLYGAGLLAVLVMWVRYWLRRR